jgi:hypothetical protein
MTGCAAACASLAFASVGLSSSTIAQDLVFNQYSVYRISPTAKYFTPGSIIRGYNFNGVLKVELVCRHRVDIEKDENILKDKAVSTGFFSEKGFTFDTGAKVTEVLNAEFGANLVNTVTMAVTDVTIYEYSAEDLAAIRKELLKRPACAEAVENPRNEYRPSFNGAPAGLFQNQRFAIGNISYKVEFNRNNPKAASFSIQSQVTKTLQVKFGLTHLNASASELKGENVVIGLNPIWQPSWN